MTPCVLPVRVMDFRGTYKGGGGPDKTILHSAALHDPRQVEVLVCYLRQPNDDGFQIPEQAKNLGIRYVDLVDGSLLDWHCIRRLKKLIRENDINLLHSHDDKTLLYSVILKYFVPGLRIMHTCHSHAEYARESFSSSRDYVKFKIRKKVQLWLMQRHFPPIITISENTRQRLVRGGLQANNVKVLHNGIDIDYWSRNRGRAILRQELGLTENDFLIGTVARITYDKDLPTFFKVVRQVREQEPRVRFVFVGDGYGDELAQAKKATLSMGLGESIIFTGHRTDLLDVYASFDLFLMTSITEGLPNTVLEAMAMETPVVSTCVGGVPELVRDGVDGLLCPVGDDAALTAAVLALLLQPGLRRKMAANARKRVEKKFSFSQRVRVLENMYCYFSGLTDSAYFTFRKT